jgi:rhodanese-related sulfurtransferase
VSVAELTVAEVSAGLSAGVLSAVDVREAGEWQAGHIEGASWIPMSELADRVAELPQGPLAIVCRSGSRSGMVADWLARAGVDAANMVGGMQAWQAAALPIVPAGGWIA